jgi:hypothetical protein
MDGPHSATLTAGAIVLSFWAGCAPRPVWRADKPPKCVQDAECEWGFCDRGRCEMRMGPAGYIMDPGGASRSRGFTRCPAPSAGRCPEATSTPRTSPAARKSAPRTRRCPLGETGGRWAIVSSRLRLPVRVLRSGDLRGQRGHRSVELRHRRLRARSAPRPDRQCGHLTRMGYLRRLSLRGGTLPVLSIGRGVRGGVARIQVPSFVWSARQAVRKAQRSRARPSQKPDGAPSDAARGSSPKG